MQEEQIMWVTIAAVGIVCLVAALLPALSKLLIGGRRDTGRGGR